MRTFLFTTALLCGGAVSPALSATLVGRAVLPADTFSPGPTSGQFIFSAVRPAPYQDRQPVQGFSAIIPGPAPGTWIVMQDNGFGSQANSADIVLRIYGVEPDWRTGQVHPVDIRTGERLASFDSRSFVALSDPNRQLRSPLQADLTNYYNRPENPPVDASIRGQRLLTGADFDIESVRLDHRGRFWFSDEFGPFLFKTDAQGRVLGAEIGIPGVFAPQNPFRGDIPANLPTSGGLEGLAISPDGKTLYPMLEKPVSGDPSQHLRIYAFDVDTETFTDGYWLYPLTGGDAIGELTAIDANRFLVIERDSRQGAAALFKQIFQIDLRDYNLVDGNKVLRKSLLVDLLAINDPEDLDADGSSLFRFPYVTIEAVAVVDPFHIVVVNDNNYPFSTGRQAGVPDSNEFILLRLDQPLVAVPEPAIGFALLGLGAVALGLRKRQGWSRQMAHA